MWPFTRTQRLDRCGILQGATDWHSHIPPGVDDGVKTMEESLEILDIYEALGIHKVWLTPHIMEDIPNTTSHLRQRFEELRAAYTGPITLRLSAENMIDALFQRRLDSGDLLPYGDQADALLVETSYFTPPMNLYGTLEQIKAHGYHPVLAHPERYVYMTDDDHRRLRKLGVRFQLNIGSLLGTYGPNVQKLARELLRDSQYDCAGSDIHTIRCLQRHRHAPLPYKDIVALNKIPQNQ